MKVIRTIKEIRQIDGVELCSNCEGHGWFWSDLEFGDLPGDEEKICCRVCDGTGRLRRVIAEVELAVPINKEI